MRSVIPIWIVIHLLFVDVALGRRLRKYPDELRTLVVSSGENAIPQQYILRYKDAAIISDIEQRSNELATLMGARILSIYRSVFKGFAFSLYDANTNLTSILAKEVDVGVVEQDTLVTLDSMELVSDEPEWDSSLDEYVVPNGLDRLDQVSLPLDQQYTFHHTGKNITAYILDTGLYTGHTEFQGRARCGFDATSTEPKCADNFNHGTHVAAIVGGTTTGVAKLVDIVSVKVVANDGGTASLILSGIEYVMQQKNSNPNQPMVVNMSLGGFYSASVNQAVTKLITAGVVVVTAAGNRGINACLVSPASAKGVITVGASAITEYQSKKRDRRAFYSNTGTCVDIFALGTKIKSASTTSTTSYRILSGTSMAAPHVTGVVAMYLQRNPKLTPAQVKAMLLKDATKGKLMIIYQQLSPNKLLYIGNLT